MVFAAKPVISLLKVPVPVPFTVWSSSISGSWEVLQQTPLAVTFAPPSDVTSPPPYAELSVMAVIASVVTSGSSILRQRTEKP